MSRPPCLQRSAEIMVLPKTSATIAVRSRRPMREQTTAEQVLVY
jgi:hypothetical protein